MSTVELQNSIISKINAIEEESFLKEIIEIAKVENNYFGRIPIKGNRGRN